MMRERAVLELLDWVRGELDAQEARLQLGGEEPAASDCLSHDLGGGWRLVVTFAEPPADLAESQVKLTSIVESFSLDANQLRPPNLGVPRTEWIERRLDETAMALAQGAGAVAAVVVDGSSPELWAHSQRREGDQVPDLVQFAGALREVRKRGIELRRDEDLSIEQCMESLIERGCPPECVGYVARELPSSEREWHSRVVLAEGLAALRLDAALRHGPTSGGQWVARRFAGAYYALLGFVEPPVDLVAERAFHRLLPLLEALLLRLPPRGPEPPRERASLRLL